MSDRRKLAMAKLAVHCSYGASKEKSAAMLAHRDFRSVQTEDLEEAVERLAVMERKRGNAFPHGGELLSVCRQAAEDRRRAEFSRGESQEERRRPMSADEQDQCLKILALGRAGIHWCHTCGRFDESQPGRRPGAWRSCHYREDLAYWQLHRSLSMTRADIHAAYEELTARRDATISVVPDSGYREVVEHELPAIMEDLIF